MADAAAVAIFCRTLGIRIYSREGYGVANTEFITRCDRHVYYNDDRTVWGLSGMGMAGVLAIVEVAHVDQGRRAGGALERAAPAHLAAHARHTLTGVGLDD